MKKWFNRFGKRNDAPRTARWASLFTRLREKSAGAASKARWASLFTRLREKSAGGASKARWASLFTRLREKSAGGASTARWASLFARLREKSAGAAPKAARQNGVAFLLEFRCRGKRFRTLRLDGPQQEISVGKAPDNDLQLPETDCSSGAHHAVIRPAANGVRLTACDNRKIYFHGEALSEVVLKPNDRASLGDSEIFVRSGIRGERRPCDVHRLEMAGGDGRRTMIRLEKSPFRIGAAPDNDLVLKSDVISRHHAEIRMAENGETWLKDLRSSNGTFVNGARLERQERMLMDSDEISFACFDYRFLDRNVVHTRTQFGRKMLIMGITVLLTLLCFGLFYMAAPSAETVINAVDFYLCRKDYDAAGRILTKMPDSRGFPRYEKQYQEYRLQIPRYRSTWDAVLKFQSLLQESRWNDAAENFGKLELSEPQAWNQADPATEPKLKELGHAKDLLDTMMALRAVRTSLNVSIEEVGNFWRKLSGRRETFAEAVKHDPEYLQPLHRTLREQLEKLDFDMKALQEIDRKMLELTDGGSYAELTEFIRFLEARLHQVSGGVRVYIRDLSARLQTIQHNMKALDENDQALFDLRMADIRPVEFISLDDCMMIPQLYLLRRNLEERLAKQLRSRNQWNGLQKLLSRYRLRPGCIPDEVALFSDEKHIEEIIVRLDDSPEELEVYDRVFGQRYFYEVLQQTVHSTNNIYASDLIPDMKVVPSCILLKDLYRGVSEALAWFSLPQNQWLIQGRMKETRDDYRRILDTRKTVLRVFENIASRNRGSRQYFIAKTAYFFFAPARPEVPAKMLAFAAEWRKFRLKQQSFLEHCDLMDAEQSEAMLKNVIEHGIPGDPVFNWVRSMRRDLRLGRHGGGRGPAPSDKPDDETHLLGGGGAGK